jgi:transcription antitermination factor NusG
MSSIDSAPNSGFPAIGSTTSRPKDNLSWYALQIQSKLGSVAFATLSGKGYQAYLPMYHAQRRWSDRVKQLDLPLFPGYMFCLFDVRARLPILTAPGVISVVGAGKTPIPIDDAEIEAVRAVLRSGLGAQPWPWVAIGSKVCIERGPLAGVEGIITNTDKVYRLVVSVSLLQRSVAVEIERAWARPIADGVGPRPVASVERVRVMGQAG